MTWSGPPRPEAVTREEWATLNLDSLSDMLGPVTERMEERMSGAGPLAGPLRMVAGSTVAAEAGLVMGYMSTRVLGQYELSLLQPEQPARLLFVTPNVDRAVRELDVERDSFAGWLVLHELTHVCQFEGVPWLREHLGGLIREYLSTVEVRVQSGGAGGVPALPRLDRLVEAFREGGLIALVQSREQRRILDSVQAAMSVIEGYSELVMDALGEQVLPHYEGLRVAMERRRSNRSAPERVLQRLLGLEMKMRQYQQGRSFCDAVHDAGGMELLNKVWEAPEALPTIEEIESPDHWIARIEQSSSGLTPCSLTCRSWPGHRDKRHLARNPRPIGVYVHVFAGILLLSLVLISLDQDPNRRDTQDGHEPNPQQAPRRYQEAQRLEQEVRNDLACSHHPHATPAAPRLRPRPRPVALRAPPRRPPRLRPQASRPLSRRQSALS